ncbi:MAG: RelA/SpoT domain-containing protein [Deltaproteobacteria bacterium]|nr:RelA/SpoT domain-containing protein [Deltaproteobacteria bacterium]
MIENLQIDEAVQHYVDNKHLFEQFAEGLILHLGKDPQLCKYIHFIKFRLKDREHLRNKLIRILLQEKAKGNKNHITKENIFSKINDLAGIRILHLHTDQIEHMNPLIIKVLNEHKYKLIKGPIATCWDIEYEQLFKRYGIKTESRYSMYTSIHYVIEANQKTKITAELQVRTMMEEVWGEVSHMITYPDRIISHTCEDQLKILARFTSGCTRLVDCIFKTSKESLSHS